MTKLQKRLSIIFAAIIVAFLAVSFVLNYSLVEEPLDKFLAGEIDLKDFASKVQSVYKSKVEYKNSYININGLFARISGRQVYNDVVRLNNGMLTYGSIPAQDMDAFADGLIEYNNFLEEIGVEYTYIQCPNKSDINDELIPVGAENYGNKNANVLIENLGKAGVDYLDLRSDIAGNVELVEKHFFDTDHHWNADASFYAYKEIVKLLKEKFPDAEFDENALLESSWNREVYEDWFLGSHGKRVGEYFAGVDDLIVYTPKFDTDMSLYIQKYTKFLTGDFEDVNMHLEYLDEPDYFVDNPYVVYIGGDYPIVQHVNYNAKNDLKVLIFKDSFSLAVQSFLSTQVRELVVVDPRYYGNYTLSELTVSLEPDIAFTLINPSSFSSYKYYQTGVAEGRVHAVQKTEKLLGSIEKLDVVANTDQAYRYYPVTDLLKDGNTNNLNYNTKYTLRIKDVEILRGKCDGFAVALFDSKANKFITSYTFDFDYNKDTGYYEWTFITPESGDGRLKVLIYAGLHSQTAGNTLRFKDVTLSKWVK